MPHPLYQVDAFTAEPYAGNPAAVVLLPGPASERWMQAVAAEMNLSETAFLHREGTTWRLRWFTPAAEVDLCGHATLASAHALREAGLLAEGETARFATRGGALSARVAAGVVELDFPATPPEPAPAPPELCAAVGVAPRWTGRSPYDWLLLAGDEAEVRALSPDFRRLAACTERGVIVTAPGRDADFVSRFFAPAVGIDEDPVTGSAHCTLGPFWAPRLGKSTFRAFQLSRRGGEVGVRVEGERVLLTGRAVTVFRGELLG